MTETKIRKSRWSIPPCLTSTQTTTKHTQINHSGGFTLIELAITIAIVGILATIAAPNYSKYMLQQRRTDAHHLLLANAQILQRCLTLVGAYNDKGGCNIVRNSKERHYTLNTTLAPQTWSLSAVAVTGGKQEKDTDCTAINLSHTGQKSATGDKPETCW